MAENTKIEWADHTFNPWTGCSKVSEACQNCYAETWAKRCGRDFNERRRTTANYWNQPIKWNAAAHEQGQREERFVRYRVFPSLCDPFDPAVSFEWLRDFLQLIQATPNLIWMLLTKRPECIRERLRLASHNTYEESWTLMDVPNLRLGVTAENQEWWNRRVGVITAIPCVGRFVSCEPLLGDIRFADVFWESGNRVDWVIAGGESGGNARPTHSDHARSLRDQCQAAGVAFMWKQWGGKLTGRMLDACEHLEIPANFR